MAKAKKRAKAKSRASTNRPKPTVRRKAGGDSRAATGKRGRAKPLTRAEVNAALAKQLANVKDRATRTRALEPRLVAALEKAQSEAARQGFASTLKVVRPPQRPVREGSWQTPWAVVARFTWRDVVGYDELYRILDSWAGSRVTKSNGEINKHRLARIKVAYQDGSKREDYTLAETGEWALCLERAMGECDPTDTETVRRHGYVGSLASRYGLVRDSRGNYVSGSVIRHVYVWLSLDSARNIMRK